MQHEPQTEPHRPVAAPGHTPGPLTAVEVPAIRSGAPKDRGQEVRDSGG